MCDSRRNGRKAVWPFGSMLISSTVPHCILHTVSNLKCLIHYNTDSKKCETPETNIVGVPETFTTRMFVVTCTSFWIITLGNGKKKHSYQERRTTDQLMHPSTFSPFCPTHKYPAITTPLELYIYICRNSFKRPDGERNIFWEFWVSKRFSQHIIWVQFLKFSTKFETQWNSAIRGKYCYWWLPLLFQLSTAESPFVAIRMWRVQAWNVLHMEYCGLAGLQKTWTVSDWVMVMAASGMGLANWG